MTAYHVTTDNVELWIRDGRITFAPVDDAEPLRGGWALAGLVDCHAHTTFDLSANGIAPGSAAVVEANIRDYLKAGVTFLRDVGGISMAAVGASRSRMVAAGRFLAPPGRYFPGLALGVPAENLTEEARNQIAAGAGWVKLIGDWFSPHTGRMELHYDAEAMRGVVETAHAAGARVAVHCVDVASIDAAIAAGVDSIEHASNLTASHIDRMAAAGIAWCPTITYVRHHFDAPQPDVAYQARARTFYREALYELLPRAAAAGTTILAGSDTLPPEHFWREIATMVEYGLTPERALASATTDARRFLGVPDLDDGAPADVVLYPRDPRDDPEVLMRPSIVIVDGLVQQDWMRGTSRRKGHGSIDART